MLDLLSIFGFILAFLVGYQFPRKAGWGVILIAPLLGPATFTFVPSSLLPLTTYRVAFAITLGVILRNHDRHGIQLSSIFKSTFVKIVVVFNLLVFLISLEDSLKTIIFSYIPNLILAFSLCYILIRNEKDLQRLVKIFVWQAAVIGVFIMFEHFTDFDINILLRKTIPEYEWSNLRSKQLVSSIEKLRRAGIVRAMGIDGNSVQTGYRLVFLFPLTLFYAVSGKLLLKPWRSLPLLSVMIGLYLLVTRAAFVGVFVSLLTLMVSLALLKRYNIKRKLRTVVSLSMVLIMLSLFVVLIRPSIGENVYTVLVESLPGSSYSIEKRILWVSRAVDYFKAKPFTGYGSPKYVYFIISNTDDLAGPLIYLLAGGIPLALIYVIMIFYMPYSVFRLSRKMWLNPGQKEFLTYAGAAFVGGVVVLFSNWQEAHFMIMYMLYISIYKIYLSGFTNAPIPRHSGHLSS